MLKNRYATLKEASRELEIDEAELLSRIEKGIIPAKRKDSHWEISESTLREIKPFIIIFRSPDYKVCYSKLADTYQDPREINFWIAEGIPEPKAVMRQINKDISRRLKLNKACKFLEVGCGCGLQALMGLKSKVFSYTGIDYSYSMIRKAKGFLPNHSFSVAEAKRLPFKMDSFDRILCYSVFQFFPDVTYADEAVLEFLRVCRPGGFILIGDIPIIDVKEQKKSMFWYLLKRSRYYKWLFYQSILNMRKFLRLKEDNNEKFYREFCHIGELAYSYDFFLRFQKPGICEVEIFRTPHPIVASCKRITFEVRMKKL